MNPKSGKAGSPVPPADPEIAQEADKADPGEVEKIKTEQTEKKTGKYGGGGGQPHKPPQDPEEKKRKSSWIEIELVDEQDKPVPGEKYLVTLPDSTEFPGTLDEKGFARIEGIEPGTCKVTFPKLDKDAWKKA